MRAPQHRQFHSLITTDFFSFSAFRICETGGPFASANVMRIPDYIALGVLIISIVGGRGGSVSTRHFRGPKTSCGRSHKLAIRLNSRSAICDWRGITNRISDAARIAKPASDQNRGIGSSPRLEACRQQSRRRSPTPDGFALVPHTCRVLGHRWASNRR